MTLYHQPFVAISKGCKRVEMRLFDEKRQLLKVGDFIRFTDKETGEEILTEITELRTFKDFCALYEHYDKQVIGYGEDEVADPSDMLLYYPKEAIEKWGALAITIRLC